MPKEYEPQRIFVAVKGIVLNHGRALIVRRNGFTNPDGRDWWEFPGGTLEFGEKPEQTLVRELREETGLQVVPDRLLYVWSSVLREEYEIIIITYLCSCGEISRIVLSEEHSGYMWADKNTMRVCLADDIKNALDANNIWNLI